MKKLLLIIILVQSFSTLAQNPWNYTTRQKSAKQVSPNHIATTLHSERLNLNFNSYLNFLKSSKSIAFPIGKNSYSDFKLTEVSIMEPNLAKKFPSLKTFRGINQQGDKIYIDVNSKNTHVLISTKQGDYYIDPDGDKGYIFYKASTFRKKHSSFFKEESPLILNKKRQTHIEQIVLNKKSKAVPTGDTLRTYRLAVAATGEYTSYHGGTVEDALSAIVTTINRVNSIYERDLAIRLLLVGANDNIIYTDAGTDPYSNNSANAMLGELQADIDSKIGSANYDIGHGFSTGAGGLAILGAVCDNANKAKGVTGLPDPIGDPFDVDYVSHEIGHQFGAPHTFNGDAGSCTSGSRTAESAYEPGSGSTIMAYAGICGAQNLQNFSDPYFHASSLQFIEAYLSVADNCSQKTATGNSIPVITAADSGFVIPVNTPFELKGRATDAENNLIYYCWEQFNLGPAGDPNNPSGDAPIFRSFPPTLDSIRTFPQLADIISGTQTYGEILPTYERQLDFMLTIRDDASISGVNQKLINLQVSDLAGPFTVQNPDDFYLGGSSITVNWDVAGTNAAPINCQFVDLYFSEDGGNTFSLIQSGTLNDGQTTATLPNITTNEARIKVAASDNVFFNINSTNFTVEEDIGPNYRLEYSFQQDLICTSDDVLLKIKSTALNGFNDDINLSIDDLNQDFIPSFESSNIGINDSIILSIDNPSQLSGAYSLVVHSSSGSLSRSDTLQFTIQSIDLLSPEFVNDLSNLVENAYPVFNWTEPNNSLTTYNLLLSENENFSDTLLYEQGLERSRISTIDPLNGSTTYHIQLITQYLCASDTVTRKFTTADFQTFISENTTEDILSQDSFDTIRSIIPVNYDGLFQQMKIKNLKGTHQYIGDLIFKLVSPRKTEITLLQNRCGAEQDFYLSFDDRSSNFNINCPISDSITYRPEELFSNFRGENVYGDWELLIIDTQAGDSGSLQGWKLELIISDAVLANDQEKEFGVTLYPNPVSETMTISSSNVLKFQQYKIIDLNGKVLKNGSLQPDSQYLDVSSLQSGMYMLQLSAENSTLNTITRFIKK